MATWESDLIQTCPRKEINKQGTYKQKSRVFSLHESGWGGGSRVNVGGSGGWGRPAFGPRREGTCDRNTVCRGILVCACWSHLLHSGQLAGRWTSLTLERLVTSFDIVERVVSCRRREHLSGNKGREGGCVCVCDWRQACLGGVFRSAGCVCECGLPG